MLYKRCCSSFVIILPPILTNNANDRMISIKYGLLTKCEVKMAGYWPSSLFVCLWTETKSRSINSQKKMRPISNHLDQTAAWRIYRIYYTAFEEIFLVGHSG